LVHIFEQDYYKIIKIIICAKLMLIGLLLCNSFSKTQHIKYKLQIE